MDLLLCRRFRRIWKSPSSSIAEQPYQLNETESPLFLDDHPLGLSSANEYTIVPQSSRSSSEGLSERLRRRLSRESRRRNVASRRSDRRSGTSLFSIPSKSAKYNGAVVTPHEFGSGLMSENGYDSDAQFISTPTHVADNVKAATSIGRKSVPPAQPYRNEGNSLFADDKSPLYQHTEVSLSSPEHEGWSPQAMHGFSISHEPKVPSPKARGSPRTSARVDNEATPRGDNANCGPASIAATSAASLKLFDGKDIITPTHQERPGSPRRGSNMPDHPLNLVSPSTEHPSELLITKRRQRHQVSISEDRSIHLTDLNISKMLASASTSPRILSPSQSTYENPHGSNSGTWTAQYQGGSSLGSPSRILTPVWDGGVLKLGMQDARQASSCYSPRTSSESGDGPANIEKTNMNQNNRDTSRSRTPFATLSPNASSRSVPLSGTHVLSLHERSLGKTDVLKSRFTEQFDLSRSITSLGSMAMSSEMTSPRKVSIGWMSGGRRLGYGYTVVDGDKDETAEKESGKASSTRRESSTRPHISNIIDRFRLHRCSGATPLVRPSNASDSASCDSVISSPSWRRFADRRKNHAGAETTDDRKALWSLKPGNCSTDCISEHHALGQCAAGFDETLRDSSMESATGPQPSQSPRGGENDLRHAEHRHTMRTTNTSCQYGISQKKGAQIMKFRFPSRKRCPDTASDDVSMSSSRHTVKKDNSHSTPPDKEGSIISQDAFERPKVQHSQGVNEKHLQCDDSEIISDDLASMYQDCLELFSDPE